MKGTTMTTQTAIVPSTTTLEQRAASWRDLLTDERKRRAAKAANGYAADELWGLVEAHVATFSGEMSLHTFRAYRTGVVAFVEWVRDQGVNVLRPTVENGAAWVRRLEHAGASTSTVRVRLAAGRALYRALRWSAATDAAPFADAKPKPDHTAPWDKRQPYTPADVAAMLEHAGSESNRALVLACAHGGLRISEALALTWAAVDAGNDSVAVTGKGGKVRSVAVSASLTDALAALRAEQGSTFGRVFPFGQDAARERLQRLCRRAGVTYRGWHSLRHHAGTRLYRETDNLDAVARHLGHSSLETARVYAKWADESTQAVVGKW